MRHCVKEVDSLFHPKVRWGEDSIFDAPAGIGGEPRLACGIKGIYCFHQANGADGDQVLLVAGEGVVFFDDVSHQAQVVFDELPPCRLVAGGGQFQATAFLLGGERFGKGALGAQAQGGEVALEQEQDEHGKHIGFPLCDTVFVGEIVL